MSYLERVRGTQTDSTVVPINGARREAVDGVHPYAVAIRAAWLDRLDGLAGRTWVQGDAWDTNCFVTARKLIELANSPWAGYDIADAREDYFHHAPRDHAWDKREKCWDQALQRSGSKALNEPDPTQPLPNVTTLDEEVQAASRPPLNAPIDWHELFSSDDEDQEWIIDPILPARRMVALYSAPKAGKSLLMLELAVAIARGTPVIGSLIDRPRRILYIDFENDPRGDIRARLEAMEVGPGQLENLVYLSFPSLAKFDTAQGALDLMAHVEEYDCEVVVIDTVSRAVQGEENENDTWLAFYRHAGLALKRAGVACVRLDHSGKSLEKGMRGGSAKYGDVDAVWRLSAVGEETILLECTDNRMPVPTKTITLVRESWPLLHRASADPMQAVTDARVRTVDVKLDALGVSSQASYREAGKALRDAGETATDKVIREVVKLRKLRLDAPLPSAAAAPSPHSPHTGENAAAPGGSYSPGRRITGNGVAAPPPQPHDRASEDEDLLVGCTRCFRPTTKAVAELNHGLCATCQRETGVTP